MKLHSIFSHTAAALALSALLLSGCCSSRYHDPDLTAAFAAQETTQEAAQGTTQEAAQGTAQGAAQGAAQETSHGPGANIPAVPETSPEARPAAAVTGEAPNWATVAETVSPSTVAIQVATGGGTSQGTGVVLDEDGSILTNNHVIADGRQIRVTTSDGLGYAASVVGTDPPRTWP